MYCCCLRCTQIYITEEQERRIAARAADAGVPKAEVIRRMLDEGLGVDDGAEERRRAIRATAGALPDADDWENPGAGARRRRRRAAPAPRALSTLFDSTVLIAHLRGDGRATELLLDAAREGALCSMGCACSR